MLLAGLFCVALCGVCTQLARFALCLLARRRRLLARCSVLLARFAAWHAVRIDFFFACCLRAGLHRVACCLPAFLHVAGHCIFACSLRDSLQSGLLFACFLTCGCMLFAGFSLHAVGMCPCTPLHTVPHAHGVCTAWHAKSMLSCVPLHAIFSLACMLLPCHTWQCTFVADLALSSLKGPQFSMLQ